MRFSKGDQVTNPVRLWNRPGPETFRYAIVPSLPPGSLVLVAAILGWMPTGIDVSVWHSFWTLEKMKELSATDPTGATSERIRRLRDSLWDMRTGYFLSLATGLMFVTMGAVHLAGRGAELKGVEFAQALSTAYTSILGPWMYHVFMLTALFAMFSTSYTVIDGFSRSFSECCAAPLLYAFNLYCVTHHIDDPACRPSAASVYLGLAGIVVMAVALGTTVYVKLLM